MITVTKYKNKKVGVLGLGKAGAATIEALLAGGATVYAWDDSESTAARYMKEKQHPALFVCHFYFWPWAELKLLVPSPGIPLTHPKPHEALKSARKHKAMPIVGDIELLFDACPQARYVAITGTNGKSTTTTLIGHILQEAGLNVEIGGNLGTPALELAPLGKDGIYVLELSSYQLDLVRTTRFNVAVFLNITPDHLDRHGSMRGYVNAKKHIFDHQKAKDVAVIAVDDQYTQRIAAKKMTAKTIMVSAQKALKKGIYVEDGIIHDGAARLDISGIVTLTGRHNWQNAAAAYAAARACGISPQQILKAMKNFAGLRHRLQLVDTIHGVRFINDSKATNADATSNALAPYENIYWIAGGKAKAGGIASLKKYFPKVAHAFLIGEAEAKFAKTLEGKVPYTRCKTLENATKAAAQMAFADGKRNAVVLLSPACASFDQWKNFEQRGDAFCRMVEDIRAQEKTHAS